MAIDMRTLILVLGITQLIQCIVFLQQYRINRAYGGISWWLSWSGISFLGYVFMLVRQIPSLATVSIFLQNICLVAGMICLYVGTLRFLGRKEEWKLIGAVFAAFLLPFAYYLYTHDRILARGVIVSGALIVFALLTAQGLYTKRTPSIASAANYLAAVLLAYCVIYAFRMAGLLFVVPDASFFAPTPFNYIPALAVVLVNLLLTFGFLMMMEQRLTADIRESKEHFELVFNASPDAILVTGVDTGLIKDVNERFVAVMGFTRAESLGRSTLELGLWEDPDARRSLVHEVIIKGRCDHFEAIFMRKDRTRMPAEVSAKAITLEGMPHMLCVIRDITAHKKAEKSLMESEDRYRNLFANSPDAIYINRNNVVVLANNACARLFGAKSPDELIGKSPYELFHPESHNSVRERIYYQRSENKPVPALGQKIVRLDGSTVDVEVVAAPFLSGNSSDIHVILRDITERKKAQDALSRALEKEVKAREVMVSMLEDNNLIRDELEENIADLKRAQDMLVHSEKLASLGKLVSEIAHEVNNPLMVISGNAQLSLMSGQAEGELKENLRTIIGECQRAKSIIQRLLKFSRPSKGVTKMADINVSLESVVSILEKQFMLAGVVFKREYGKGLPRISIDEQQMQEVFMNLITNAKEAMTGGGEITIRTMREEGVLRIDFSDTGCGMSDEIIQNVLEPFFTTKEKGTGLGLPVCYGIVKAHNGGLRFLSVLGKGTTVTVLLPIGEGPADA